MASGEVVSILDYDLLELSDAVNEGFDAIRAISNLMMSVDETLPLAAVDVHRIGFVISNCIEAQIRLVEEFARNYSGEVKGGC